MNRPRKKQRKMQRTPEPELMDAPEQALAYAQADFSESNQRFVDDFVRLVANHDTGRLIDLGCGPGDICRRLAHALPGWQIIGLDAGPNMLALAKTMLDDLSGSQRIELVLDQLPCELPGKPLDAIVSNSLLHHLPDPMILWQTIAGQSEPGCIVQIMDLHRPESLEQARDIVERYAADAPAVLAEDFHNSLLAAYTAEEVADQCRRAGLQGLTLTRPSDRHWLLQGRIN